MGGTIPHVVKRGEHLHEIAVRYGADVSRIWGLPENQRLKDQGRTPGQLASGDVVYVPLVKRNFLPLSSGQTNTLTAQVPKTEVTVNIHGDDGKGIANVAFEVQALGLKGQSDGDGNICIKNVPYAFKVLLVHLVERDVTLQVLVGGLDPVSTVSGKAQRLAHLGYLCEGAAGASDSTILDAFKLFCADHSMDASSVSDQESELARAHGS
jgi:hypothetical protein